MLGSGLGDPIASWSVPRASFPILLGLGVTFLLWPVAVPLGFGEVWWASQKAQWQSDAKPVPPAAPPQPVAPSPAPPPQAAAPLRRASAPARAGADATCGRAKTPPRQSRLNRRRPTPRLGKRRADCKARTRPAPLPRRPRPKLYYRVTVRDGGTLQSGGVVIKLAGIAARDDEATCKGANGKAWPCGAAAKAALTRLIRARAVTCEMPKQSARRTSLPAARWRRRISPPGWCARAGPSRKTLTSPRLPKRRQPPNRTSSGSGAARSERRGRSLMRRVLVSEAVAPVVGFLRAG